MGRSNPITFVCQSEVFNGSQCAKQCKSCAPGKKRRASPFDSYEVREGRDGKVGIYTRDYNCRLATFNANTFHLQTALKALFDRAHKPPTVKKRKRTNLVRDKIGGGAFMNDVGDQGYRCLRLSRRR